MLEAFFWGIVAASSLLAGTYAALRFDFEHRLVGLIMAFAAGVLLSAVAYDLVLEAAELHAPGRTALGLFAGAITFFVGDSLISRRKAPATEHGVSALPIVLGAVLDGIPESVVLGLTLVQSSISISFLVAVFLSNFPEALVASSGLREEGWSHAGLYLLWGSIALVSGIAAMLGFGALSDAPAGRVAFVQAFAAGAILTMLADSMMPEAFENSGNQAGLLTTLGFATAFALEALG